MPHVNYCKTTKYLIKHDLAKYMCHNLSLLLNKLPEIVNKLISHSTQDLAKYVKYYFIKHYQVSYSMYAR